VTVEDLYGFLETTADAHPDRPLVRYEGEEWTYDEALAAIDRRAAMLADRGVGAGDRVGLLLPTDPETVFLLFAAARLGAACVLLDHRQGRDILAYLLDDADPRLLVVDEVAHDSYRGVAGRVDIPDVLTHDVDDPAGPALDEAVAAAPDDAPRPEVDPLDVAAVTYTSGTTGPPKGVPNPHRAFVDAGRRGASYCDTGPSDRALLVLPLFHANPLTYGLMQMVAVGGSVALVREFSASGFWATARESGATYFTHVGSILEILERTYGPETDPGNPMRFAMGGAAHFDADAQRWFEETFDLQVLRLYGLSEVGAGLVTCCRYRGGGDGGPTDQGPVAEPFDVRILREDGREWADPGDPGEILVRPERPGLLFTGYRNRPETTVEEWRDLWMHTGDLGIVEDGRLRYLGRRTTSIRTGGELVSPWELESVVEAWDGVADVAAVGVPDPVLGEAINLYVVPASGVDLDEADLHARCRAELADHLVPRYVTLVEGIPRTSTQKIARSDLSERGTGDAWEADPRE
jgi:crotonobetaine/carnitine-CoA ligase